MRGPAGHLPPQLFPSFWLAGFEGACHINSSGLRLDMIAATQHDRQADEDYARLREVGIRAARDGVRWHLIERAGRYDFSSLQPLVQAAQRHGIRVIWTLCHYGWPDDLDLFAPAFVDRFARFCKAVARFVGDHLDGVPFYAPMNEISFFAWAIGKRGFMYPYALGRDHELKRQLVRATIAGCEALWDVDPRARIVHPDPLIHVIPPRGRPDLAQAAAAQRAAQFASWDMLAGRRDPDLGGHPRYLDIVGVNYYHANQWEHPDQRLRWEDVPRDPRWLPFSSLLAEVYYRYWRPVVVSETSHFGAGRGRWIREVTQEVGRARHAGVGVEGLCIYPLIDRPDWDDPDHWHHSGLWDLVPGKDGKLERVLAADYAEHLRQAQAQLRSRAGS